MRSSLTYRGQLAVMAAIHRERAEAYFLMGHRLFADGKTRFRPDDEDRAAKHRQWVVLLEEQIKRLAKEAKP